MITEQKIECAGCGHIYLVAEFEDVSEFDAMLKASGWAAFCKNCEMIYLCAGCAEQAGASSHNSSE